MPNKAVITWRGDFGNPDTNYTKTIIKGVTSEQAFITLLGVLDGYSLANVARRSYNAIAEVQDAAPDADADMDAKLIVVMKDTVADSILKMNIPAPIMANFTNEGQGLRLDVTELATIVGAVATATGKTLTGLYGYYDHKK